MKRLKAAIDKFISSGISLKRNLSVRREKKKLILVV